MRFLAAVVLLFSFYVIDLHAAEVPSTHGQDVIPNSYIIVLRDGISKHDFDMHRNWATSVHQASVQRRGVHNTEGLRHVYDVSGWKAYSGIFDQGTIKEIARNKDVRYIEPDRKVKTLGIICQTNAPGWNLPRISQKVVKTKDYCYDETAGNGITVYVVDSGVNIDDSELYPRATWGTNMVDQVDKDENGHGTWIAQIIAGKTRGVAKQAKVVAVKVINKNGSGTTSGIIQGINWAVNHAKQAGILGKAVMNLSIGGSVSQSLNSAVTQAALAGLFVSVAAGDDNRDASAGSPASAQGACVAAACGNGDTKSSFSNYGPVVDIFAPGANILISNPNGGTNSVSGSSYAAAHLSGMGAYLIALEGIPAQQVCQRVIDLGNPVIKNPGSGTTNKLLYNGSGL
ncbi:Secreted subtilisin-like serine protease sub11 [Myotisia sp. PD_48]|nr:Secreted subtilisin-like serine protease sub11 [Myotisia sp. PD_48]